MADDLLQALAALEREALQHRCPAWDELAHGRISPDEAVARVRSGGVPEAELASGRELFTPPNASFDEALVERLVTMTSAVDSRAGGFAAANGERAVAVAPGGGRRRALVVVAIIAAAAAVLVLALPPRDVSRASAPTRAQIPPHEVWIAGDATVRGGATDVPQIAAGAGLRVYLRPARSHAITPSVAACVRQGDVVRVLSLAASAAAPGETLELATRLPADLGAGRWELVALLAGGELPADVAASCASPSGDLQVARTLFDVRR